MLVTSPVLAASDAHRDRECAAGRRSRRARVGTDELIEVGGRAGRAEVGHAVDFDSNVEDDGLAGNGHQGGVGLADRAVECRAESTS